jgi:hypothetical protein
MFYKNSKIEYTTLNQVEISTENQRPRKLWLLFSLILGFSIVASFAVGRFAVTSSVYNDILGEAWWLSEFSMRLISAITGSPSPHMFSGNESFIGRPSMDKDLAWKQLLPQKGGFFTHPIIAKEKSVFAVFHQMHCLVGNVLPLVRIKSHEDTGKFVAELVAGVWGLEKWHRDCWQGYAANAQSNPCKSLCWVA